MKRILVLLFLSSISLGLYSQSYETINEKYPDDMYTEIGGKEVRVNTLPKRIIDSLEALPPLQRLHAIYRVEQVERAREQTKPAETFNIREYDYWERNSVERTISVYRNDDGTTRLEDNSGNWMLFKTEYEVNEYTGEKSSTPISGKKYYGNHIDGRRYVSLLAAYRILPNGYKLEVNGEKGEISLTYMPLNVSFTTISNKIQSNIWFEWVSEDNFQGDFNTVFHDKDKMLIKGPDGQTLISCGNIIFSDMGGRRINGGYYDKGKHYMYYGLGDTNNSVSPNGYVMKMYSENKDIDSILEPYFKKLQDIKEYDENFNARKIEHQKKLPEIKAQIVALEKKLDGLNSAHEKQMAEYRKKYPLNYPQKIGKEIKELTQTYEKNKKELLAAISELNIESQTIPVDKNNPLRPIVSASFEALDITLVPCIPSDKIKELKKGENVCEVLYENGDYLKVSKLKNGEAFDGKVHRPQGLWTIKLDENNKVNSEFVFTKGRYKNLIYKGGFSRYAWSLAIVNMEQMVIKNGARLYSPAEKRWLTVLKETGDIEEYLKEEQAKRDAIEKAQSDKEEEDIYEAYCKKYGKKNVDYILNSQIHIGMPFSVVQALCVTWKTDEMTSGDWYEVYYGGSKYDYQNKTLVPQDIRYVPKVLLSKYLVRVSNGVVQSVHKMKIY